MNAYRTYNPASEMLRQSMMMVMSMRSRSRRV